LKTLREQGVAVACFERGCDVGGLWRYQNRNGLSGAYASLRTNVSRSRMQYPSFPMPDSYSDFPHHSEMAAYLGAYAEEFGLRALIRFGSAVERLEPDRPGGGGSPSMTAQGAATGPSWSRSACSGAQGSRATRAASTGR
jgi:cation diffusion facilitator CzcD-associated flavoprotein CzcO